MLSVTYAECHYAECPNVECRGANWSKFTIFLVSYSLAILQIIFSLKHGVLATKISVYKIFSMAFNFVKMKTKVLAGLGVYKQKFLRLSLR
jgi:hypothetical protein